MPQKTHPPTKTQPEKHRCRRLLIAGGLWAAGLLAYFGILGYGEPLLFPDNYLLRSRESLLDPRFYTGDRPFVTHLFFKLWGSEANLVVFGHHLLSVLSWSFLGFALGVSLRVRAAAWGSLVVFGSAALWWNVAGWNRVLLSESVSISLLAAWYGALLLFRIRQNGRSFAGLCFLTFFFSFTRDSASTFLLVFGLLVLAWAWFDRGREPTAKRWWTGYVAFICLVFAMQAGTGRLGKRHLFPLFNVMLQRVLPVEAHVAWFKARGAPLELLEADPLEWKGAWASSHDWALYGEPRFAPFKQWMLDRGTFQYGLFLLTHPGYTLGQAWAARDLILAHDLAGYTQPPPRALLIRWSGFLWRPQDYLPAMVLVWVFYALLIVFTRTGAKRDIAAHRALRARAGSRVLPPVLPLLLMLSFLANGVLIFHADAMEVPRHCLLVTIGLCVATFHMGFQMLEHMVESFT